MKRIAILLPTLFPVPAVQGGAIETLIEGLVRQNEVTPTFEFTVFSAYNEEAARISKEFVHTRFEYVKASYKMYKPYYFIYRLVKKALHIALPDNLARLKMVRQIKCEDYDWILFEAGEVFSLLCYYKKLDPRKTIVHAHGMITPIPTVDKCFSYFLSISQFVSDYWASKSMRPLETYKVWKNCIPVESFCKGMSKTEQSALRHRLGIETGDFVIIFTGRIIPEKGILELLESIHLIKTNNIKLIIIGSANFKEKTSTEYERKVSAEVSKLGNRVVLTGYIPNVELYKYYQLADVAVVPSIWDEPAGLVVIEAMAAGKPVITTGSGGIKEYVDRESAIFVNRGMSLSKEIAEAINYLIDNPDKRMKMSECAKDKAKNYSMRYYLTQLEDIISEISNT